MDDCNAWRLFEKKKRKGEQTTHTPLGLSILREVVFVCPPDSKRNTASISSDIILPGPVTRRGGTRSLGPRAPCRPSNRKQCGWRFAAGARRASARVHPAGPHIVSSLAGDGRAWSSNRKQCGWRLADLHGRLGIVSSVAGDGRTWSSNRKQYGWRWADLHDRLLSEDAPQNFGSRAFDWTVCRRVHCRA